MEAIHNMKAEQQREQALIEEREFKINRAAAKKERKVKRNLIKNNMIYNLVDRLPRRVVSTMVGRRAGSLMELRRRDKIKDKKREMRFSLLFNP